MRLGEIARLAWPRTGADRVRAALICAATAFAGALLVAAGSALSISGRFESTWDPATDRISWGAYSPLLAESGLRLGYAFGIALVTIPFFALAVQALRLGTARRERWLAALRLAGATPREVRRIAAVECGMAGGAGGVLALPAYGVLWLAVRALPGPRLLPALAVTDLFDWAAALLLLTATAALAGWIVHRHVIGDPLSASRPGARKTRLTGATAVLAAGLAVLATGFALATTTDLGDSATPVTIAAVVGLVAAALASGPLLVRGTGRLLSRSRNPVDLLAGARMVADPRTGGRASGVLVVCGIALGVSTVQVAGLLRDKQSDLDFFLTGYGLATACALVSALVAVVTMIVGAAEELGSHRRSTAALAALGMEPRQLRRVHRRQLTRPAVLAIVVGTLGGVTTMSALWAAASVDLPRRWLAVAVPGVGLVAAALVWLGAVLATWLLTAAIRDATDPENLRAT